VSVPPLETKSAPMAGSLASVGEAWRKRKGRRKRGRKRGKGVERMKKRSGSFFYSSGQSNGGDWNFKVSS